MDGNSKQDWFEDWFNSPYYHVLYKNRNEEEAELFLTALIRKIPIVSGSKILDLACGRGRHSHYLSKLGYNVLGIDLSENNIAYAKQFENEQLLFKLCDMRDQLPETHGDYVLNLFTSFGYFTDPQDDIKVLENVHRVLNNTGKFIIDYLNVSKAISSLGESENKLIGEINFDISRSISNNFIIKNIRVDYKGNISNFKEMVKTLDLHDFENYFAEVGFTIDQLYGDYSLNPYDKSTSDRLLMVVSKM